MSIFMFYMVYEPHCEISDHVSMTDNNLKRIILLKKLIRFKTFQSTQPVTCTKIRSNLIKIRSMEIATEGCLYPCSFSIKFLKMF